MVGCRGGAQGTCKVKKRTNKGRVIEEGDLGSSETEGVYAFIQGDHYLGRKEGKSIQKGKHRAGIEGKASSEFKKHQRPPVRSWKSCRGEECGRGRACKKDKARHETPAARS